MPDDLSKRLVDAGTALAPDRDVDPTPIAAAARRSHRRRRAARWGALTAIALVGAGLVAGRVVGSDDSSVETATETPSPGGWEQLPDPPLSPRDGATAVWTGTEVVVVGGWEFLCPPGADCAGPAEPPFSDGAAYDPATDRWRTISPAPMPIYGERAVAVDGAVYLLVSCDLGGAGTAASTSDACAGGDAVVLLRFDAAADEWTVLAAPPNDRDYELAAAGSLVVAYSGSDESGEVPDWLFDTSSLTWREIPDDPHPAVFDRTMSTIDDGETLILIAAAISGTSQPDRPNLAARLDVDSGTWEELPSPPGRGFRGWGVDDVIVLEPHFGGQGGQLDVEQETWFSLPSAPERDGWENEIAGVVGQHDAVYTASSGWLLDVGAQRWIELEPLDGRATFPDTNITAVGRDLFLFGGERWEGDDGELLGDAWIWRAPRADPSEAAAPSTTTGDGSGDLTIELVNAPLTIEGWDLAVRITPAGGATSQHGLDEFDVDEEPRSDFGGSFHLTVPVPSGRVALQAHLTFGQGPGPREPDFVAGFDGSLCSPVEVSVPTFGAAAVRMDWATGCLESEFAPAAVPSDLLPSRPSDVSGAVVEALPGDTDQRPRLAVSSGQPESFDGARLYLDDAVIVSADGDGLAISDLEQGTRVEVWMAGCDESAPPACTVEAIRVRR